MARVSVFNTVSLDGYFADAQGSMQFAHSAGPDPEFEAFTTQNARSDARLLFGRKTYEMMRDFWTTPEAKAQRPVVAERLRKAHKLVASRSLKAADWEGSEVVKGNLARRVDQLKNDGGTDLVILGSGEIVAQLGAAGLVDEVSLVIVPMALGAGRTLFEGLKAPLRMTLVSQRAFKSGRLLLRYLSTR